MDDLCSTKDGESHTEASTPSEFEPEFTVEDADTENESQNENKSLQKALCAVDFYPSFTPPSKPEDSSKVQKSVAKETKPKQVKSVKDYMKKRMGDKFGFKFPKNGWTCRACQNYNFPQRGSCMRCKKVKTEEDVSGMPNHLKNKSFYAKYTPEKYSDAEIPCPVSNV